MSQILMVEFKDVRYDARVRKQAESLANAGFSVYLIMFNSSLKKKRIRNEGNLVYHEISFPHYDKARAFQDRLKRQLHGIMKILYINWYVLSHHADVYHAHNLKFLFSSIISSRIHKGKVVYDAHELHSQKQPNNNIKNKFLNCFKGIYEKLLVKKVSIFIQASEERANFISKKYQINKPLVIENHIKTTNITRRKNYLREKCNLSKSDKIVIYTGGIRFGGNRKIEKVIESLSLLDKNVHFVLIGPANERDKDMVKYYAEKFTIEGRVHLLEPVNYEMLVNEISDADISIIPIFANSLNSKYSALNKISESLMAGLPIACSNYENLKRIIYDNPVGIVGQTFDVCSIEAIADVVRKILNPKIKKVYSQNAIELAKKLLNWENEEKKLLNAYSKLFDLN